MASIIARKNGTRLIKVQTPAGEKYLTLGNCSKRNAETVKGHVEVLVDCCKLGTPLPTSLTGWLSGCSESVREKLGTMGLLNYTPPNPLAQLGAFVDHFIESREGVVKKSTNTHTKQVARELKEYFGVDKSLTEITRHDCEAYRKWLSSKHRPATVGRRLNESRMFFKGAKLDHLISENPFEHVKASSGDVSERLAYVPADVIRHILEYAPNAHWRLLIALARFGGLRMVSEPFSLKWSGIDWAAGRMTVYSPKTEHLAGKASRTMPIFTELRPYLEEVRDATQGGDDYVFPLEWRQRAYGAGGWANANFRTTFQKIIAKAGVPQWTRLFHSLRGSCLTDLARQFPTHVVTAWLGNSPTIAQRHYLTTIDADFTQAVATDVFGSGEGQTTPTTGAHQNAHQSLQEMGSNGKQDTITEDVKCLEIQGFASDCYLPQSPGWAIRDSNL